VFLGHAFGRIFLVSKLLMKEIHQSVPVNDEGAPHPPEAPAQSEHAPSLDDGDNFTLRTLRTRAEIQAIQRALGHTGWNRSQAARLLKISYRSLLFKIQQHKITHQSQ
jgi:DNA-binding NtrC family response regulator